MSNYRNLTQTEIEVLENNVCWAEDWQRVLVDEEFKPYNFHRVMFYGDIRLGAFHKMVEVTKGFQKHSGINDATLRQQYLTEFTTLNSTQLRAADANRDGNVNVRDVTAIRRMLLN